MTDDDRTPPTRIRTSKLQEVQVPALVSLDQACAAMYHELGFDAAEVPARTERDFYVLPKGHAVRVAEADYVVAGYSAWRDESPGVAYLEELSVHPDFQRFGVGTKLLEQVIEEALEAGFSDLVLRAWDRAPWASSFYAKNGFVPLDEAGLAAASEKVRTWFQEKGESGREFLRPGESARWKKLVKQAASDDDESESEG